MRDRSVSWTVRRASAQSETDVRGLISKCGEGDSDKVNAPKDREQTRKKRKTLGSPQAQTVEQNYSDKSLAKIGKGIKDLVTFSQKNNNVHKEIKK